MLQTKKTAVVLRVSNIGVQLLQNLLSQMIIVPKSLKLCHWLQKIEEVNIRASSLCFFVWLLRHETLQRTQRNTGWRQDMPTTQEFQKNAVCVPAGEKKTNHPTWPLETFNPPGNETISLRKRKIIGAKVTSGRGYTLVPKLYLENGCFTKHIL